MCRFFVSRLQLLLCVTFTCGGLGAIEAFARDGHVISATARIAGLGAAKVSGEIKFSQTHGPIRVVGKLTGLAPGRHGIHVHVNGSCDSADGMSAGGHFNPLGAPHGDAGSAKRHPGDMGNIVANADGQAIIDTEISGAVLTLIGTTSLLNRSVIVHAAPDDFSQPVGNAGARIGCGVVESDHMAM